ncbi:caveolin-2-like [Epinephelus fuscoguttatus]|uniref:caveolin-2-like n=2 Tax=Epinephelus TaxID=94231 RepID=UPI0020CFFB26|nr:caveolin-2-like [Epinephelus fuscoguttatus]XP_049894163.1 caveolin-2-like isoform X1 [Epinephelus moara]
MITAVNQAGTQLKLEEMEDQRLRDEGPEVELMDVKVDVQSDDLSSTHSDTRPLIHDRDPKGINKSLKVTFEDVIAEPPSVRSFDKVWLWSHALFEVSRLWMYRFISLFLAVPVALAAGILFAVLSCLHIWLIMPCVQLLLINMHWVQTVWGSILNILIGPFFTSVGKCCGRISIHLAKDEDR